MPRCTRCETGIGEVKLGKRALKCYRAKHPNCSADDLFCKRCNDFMEGIVAREVAKQKKRKLMELLQRRSLEGRQSASSGSSASVSFQTIVDRLGEVGKVVHRTPTPNTSGTRTQTSRQQEDFTSPEIQYTQSQSQPTPRRDPLFGNVQDSSENNAGDHQPVQPVWHEYDEDDSDEESVCPIQIGQPIVRKRKAPVVFQDERIVPIYIQRKNFGG